MPLEQTVLTFLKSEHIGVLSLAMPDGSVHSAALHYSFHPDPLKIYFTTSVKSKKAKAFIGVTPVKASVVIGCDWKNMVTLQLDGEVNVVTHQELLEIAKDIHYANNPESRAHELEPETHMLMFSPTWWRYSNFQTKPAIILGTDPVTDDTTADWGDLLFYHE